METLYGSLDKEVWEHPIWIPSKVQVEETKDKWNSTYLAKRYVKLLERIVMRCGPP
jgi:hypothetical protein